MSTAKECTFGLSLIGQRLTSSERTLSRGEFSMLTALSWNVARLHTDRRFARATGKFDDCILLGPLVLAISMGLESHAGLERTIIAHGVSAIAMTELQSVTFPSPVYPDDTISVET